MIRRVKRPEGRVAARTEQILSTRLASVAILLVALTTACGGAAAVPVSSVSVSFTSPLEVGQNAQASAVLLDASGNVLSGRAISWSSSAAGVATVSTSGLVTGASTGTATITATSEGKSGSADVTVAVIPVASVSVSLTSPLGVGQTTQATAVVRDASSNVLSGRTISWSSSATGVAAVSPSGLVTGGRIGTATITATSEGMNGSADVTVTVLPVARVTVVLVSSRVGVGQTTAAIVTAFDATGHSLSGRAFTWTSSSAAVATVSSTGLVTATGLGTATITATSETVPGSAVLTVAAGGAATRMTAVSALSQTAGPGAQVVQPPAVVVQDATGVAVPGVSVAFAVTSGGGAVGGGAAITGADGVARASSWTLGGAGGQSVRATTPVLPAATVDFTALSRAPGDRYDVSLRFIGTMSDAQARAFVHAKERIETIVVGDLPSVPVNYSASTLANCGGVAIQETIDDIVIFAEARYIDGPGQVLGQAGPCFTRSARGLPFIGNMEFDTADLAKLEANGTLESVILHEMLHVVGFGTIWSQLGVLDTTLSTDPFFTGTGARTAFASQNGGSAYAGTPVPVENTGGTATALSHWRDTVLRTELMTGFISTGASPLSATTIGSLADIGYTVDLTQAEPFSLSFALRASPALRTGGESFADDQGVFLGDHIRPEPPVVADEYGNPVAR
jgi:uncharacterized protein YjdB